MLSEMRRSVRDLESFFGVMMLLRWMVFVVWPLASMIWQARAAVYGLALMAPSHSPVPAPWDVAERIACAAEAVLRAIAVSTG